MVYVGNLCHIVDVLIEKKISGLFLASDDIAISTTKLIELIAKGLDKKVYLLKIPFFESFLKLLKPSFHKRLYGSLEVNNTHTKKVLELENLYSVEDGVGFMIQGEDK
jgi:UDP-glucose 4-epimerase